MPSPETNEMHLSSLHEYVLCVEAVGFGFRTNSKAIDSGDEASVRHVGSQGTKNGVERVPIDRGIEGVHARFTGHAVELSGAIHRSHPRDVHVLVACVVTDSKGDDASNGVGGCHVQRLRCTDSAEKENLPGK